MNATRRSVLGAGSGLVATMAGCTRLLGSDGPTDGEPVRIESYWDGDAWPMAAQNPRRTGVNPTSAITSPPTKHLLADLRGGIETTPIVDGEAVYTAGPLAQRWPTQGLEPDWDQSLEYATAATPVLANETLYVTTSGRTYAFDATAGTVRWERAEGSWSVSPIVEGRTLYLAHDSAPGLSAIDVETNEQLWEYQPTNGVGGLAFDAGALYVAQGGDSDDEGGVSRVDDGTETWHCPDPGSIRTPPVVGESLVFVGDTGGYVYGIDRESGDLEWSTRAIRGSQGFVAAGLGLAGETVLAPSNNGFRSVGLDATDGTERWSIDSGVVFAAPVSDGTHAYFDTTEGLTRLAVDDGEPAWTGPALGNVQSGPALVDDTLFYVSAGGGLYAVR